MHSRSVYSVQTLVISVLLFMLSLPAFANDEVSSFLLRESPEALPNYIPPSAFFVSVVILFLLGLLFFTLISIRNALTQESSKWSLSDALSEEVELTNENEKI